MMKLARQMITQRVPNHRPPACISARFQEGFFVFLNMCQISQVYVNFSVYSGDKEKLSENLKGENAYEPI
jgi:hypothetical protein